jgi:hypothetical protein
MGASMYLFFKDFSGPIATIIAAFAALSVTAYFAWHQKKIAKEQAYIAREKLRHDLYEKRYRVFYAVRKLLAGIVSQRNASEEALRAFKIDTDDSVFLFDDNLAGDFEEIRSRAQKLQSLDHLMDSMPVGEQRTDTINQSTEHFVWLVRQLDRLTEKFKPFLKLENSDIGTAGLNWRRGALRLWVIASVLWCGAVVSIGLLENKNTSWLPAESPMATTAPACKNGASSCKPWERDWRNWDKGDLKSDTTVTEQGTIIQPTTVSAWRIIAADMPWAIAPPLVALALGASLFWAFAGFRRGSS